MKKKKEFEMRNFRLSAIHAVSCMWSELSIRHNFFPPSTIPKVETYKINQDASRDKLMKFMKKLWKKKTEQKTRCMYIWCACYQISRIQSNSLAFIIRLPYRWSPTCRFWEGICNNRLHCRFEVRFPFHNFACDLTNVRRLAIHTESRSFGSVRKRARS